MRAAVTLTESERSRLHMQMCPWQVPPSVRLLFLPFARSRARALRGSLPFPERNHWLALLSPRIHLLVVLGRIRENVYIVFTIDSAR